MHVALGGYHIRDIEFTMGIDINVTKVRKDMSEAIFADPNNTVKFTDVPHLDAPVYRGMTHEAALAKLLEGKYPTIAQIINKHRFEAIRTIKNEPWSWEEKILTYADKRVMHDKIVSLEERFMDLSKRYRKQLSDEDKKKTKMTEQLYFDLEKEIFSHLDFTPEQVASLIN